MRIQQHLPTLGLFLLAATMGVACRKPSRSEPPKKAITKPSELCRDRSLDEDDFCLPAAELERQLKTGELEVLDSHITAQGVSKPLKARVRVRRNGGSIVYYTKWKQVPPTLEVDNNSPRRELAAYELQKLFLDADRYVVPPTALRCLAMKQVEGKLEGATPFEAFPCTLGVIAYWLENVTEPTEDMMEELEEHRTMMGHVADLNIFGVLAGHRDSVGMNFLVSDDDEHPRAFCVDSGMTFGMWEYNPVRFFTSAWSDVRVPALRRDSVERLRRMTRADLDKLLVVAQLEATDTELRPVAFGAPLSTDTGVRRQGRTLQLGLTREEIDGVDARRVDLLKRVDSGELRTF